MLNSKLNLNLRRKPASQVCNALLLTSLCTTVALSSPAPQSAAKSMVPQSRQQKNLTTIFGGATCGQRAYRKIRGQIMTITPAKSAKDQAVITIAHEAIPNFMEAMSMSAPLRHTSDAKRLHKGDKIRFDLVLYGGTFYIENVQKLPPDTHLKLA